MDETEHDGLESFGWLLRRHRLNAGLTQEALAEKANLGLRTIQDLEVGVHRPHDETVHRLHRALTLTGDQRARFSAAAQPVPRHRAQSTTASLSRSERHTVVSLLGARGMVEAGRTNLPAAASSFIGRAREVEEVARLLGSVRLVSLVGTGGVGKTRLAQEVARGLVDRFPDGVWLVELAALGDASLLPETVAQTLGLGHDSPQAIKDRLLSRLQGQRLLLILDNCEHLIDACARLVQAILAACPPVAVLATSREPLRLRGENVFRVPSLPIPDADSPASAVQLLRYDAVRLFAERAREGSRFALTDANTEAVVRICRHVDGIPLALELAAARTGALAVDYVASRLGQEFRLLSLGARTALPRQQTLRATLDWSYDLLNEAERQVWRQLAVFIGGFTLEAGEAVCCVANPGDGDVVDLIARLVDKSLVKLDEREGVARYRLLEPLRQYAREKLVEVGEEEATRERHRTWYTGLAERSERELRGADQIVWLERLELEHENLRAALNRSMRDAGVEDGFRLAGALGRFWFLRSYFVEGRTWLGTALARAGSTALPRMRAKALSAAGVLAWQQADLATAEGQLAQSLALSRGLGDRPGTAFALCYLGMVAWLGGDFERTRIQEEECLAIFRELGDRWGIATALRYLARGERGEGNVEHAVAHYRESLTIYRELDDKFDLAQVLEGLAQASGDLGADEEARAYWEETLRLRRSLKDRAGTGRCLSQLAAVVRRQGEYARAEALIAESLKIAREIEDRPGIAQALSELGQLAAAQGDSGRARAALEESLARFRNLGQKPRIAEALANLGNLAAAEGDLPRAGALLEESLAAFRQIGAKRSAAEALRALGAVPQRWDVLVGARASLETSCAATTGPDERRDIALSEDDPLDR